YQYRQTCQVIFAQGRKPAACVLRCRCAAAAGRVPACRTGRERWSGTPARPCQHRQSSAQLQAAGRPAFFRRDVP
ncbi:MAG: hypothetical protein ACLFM1_06415, partial [Bacteroidales bacterium]